MPFDEFYEVFLKHVKYSMVVYRREPAVERTIKFIAKFTTSVPDKDAEKVPYYSAILHCKYLILLSCCKMLCAPIYIYVSQLLILADKSITMSNNVMLCYDITA